MGQWLSKTDVGSRLIGEDNNDRYTGTIVLYEGGRLTRLLLHDAESKQVLLVNPKNISLWHKLEAVDGTSTHLLEALSGKSNASVSDALVGCACEVISTGAEASGHFGGIEMTPVTAVFVTGAGERKIYLPWDQVMVVKFSETNFLRAIANKLRPGKRGGGVGTRYVPNMKA